MTLLAKVREQGAELMERHDHLEELVDNRTQDLVKEIEVREEREQALKESEKRFKSFAGIAVDRYWESDENHIITYAPVQSAGTEKAGIQIIGTVPWDNGTRLSPAHSAALKDALQSKKEFKNLSVCWILPSGEKYYRRLSGVPLRDALGRFKGFRVIGIDETAEVLAQDEMQAVQTRFFDALEQFGIGVVLWDLNGKLQFFSKAIKRLYPQWADVYKVGLMRNELSDVMWRYCHDNGMTNLDKGTWIEKFRSESDQPTVSNTFVRLDGGVSRRYRRLLKDDWVIGLHIDVSEERHREWQLAEAKNHAEAANDAKNKFLKSISYELRTPINAILGFGQLLHRDTESELSKKQVDFVDGIESSGERLLSLVEGILELSRVKTGQIKPDITSFDCCDDLQFNIQLIQNQSHNQKIKIVNSVECGTLPLIQADRELFSASFNHLLENSIAYCNEEGEIQIFADIRRDGMVRFTITNIGQEFNYDQMSEMFTPFGEHEPKYGIPAAGDGRLYICKRYIEQMQGRMDFETVLDVGSSIWIELPIAKKAEDVPEDVKLDA